jgi:hypothetical protein
LPYGTLPMVLISILVCLITRPDGTGVGLLLMGAGALGMGIAFVVSLVIAAVIGLNERHSSETEQN